MSPIAATDLWGQSTGGNIMNNAFLDVGAPTGRASSNFRYRPGVATLRRVSCARRFQSPEADERAFDRTYRAGKWIEGLTSDPVANSGSASGSGHMRRSMIARAR
jgi:hypothetical protein